MPAASSQESRRQHELFKAARSSRTALGRWIARARLHSWLVLDRRVEGTGAAGALARVWAWQLWRRTVRRPVIVRCAEGSLLLAPSWSRATAVIAGTGLTERDDAVFVLDLLRPGDLFVDVGANIGFYTLLAARRGARVEAYEPTPEAADVCERAVAINGVQGSVRVNRAACGVRAGTVRFTTGLDIRNHIVGEEDLGVDVPVVTLDEALLDAHAPVTMLKVDAEGHDLEVLHGALGVIERLRPAILIEVWAGGGGPLAALDGLGYRIYRYDRIARRLSEVTVDAQREGNIVLISDANVDAVADRLRTAARPALRAPSIRWRV